MMMNAKNFMPHSSPDTPGLDSGAFGIGTALLSEITSSGEMSVKPQPPQKKAHLDELFRLRKEIDEIRDEKLDAEEMTMMMGQDLNLAQEEVQKKREELRRKEAELNNWREKAKSLSIELQEEKRQAAELKNSMQEAAVISKVGDESQEEDLTQLRENFEQLAILLTEKESQNKAAALRNEKDGVDLRRQITQLKETLDQKDAELAAKVSSAAVADYDKWSATLQEKQLQFETKLKEIEEHLAQEQELRRVAEASLPSMDEQFEARLREAVQDKQLQFESKLKEAEEQMAQEYALRRRAETTLLSVEEELQANSRQEQELRRVSEASLQSTKEQYETKLREADERANILNVALQKHAQEAEALLQEQANRKAVEEDHEHLQQRIRHLEAEMQDQRKRCEWFKGNSERLSREIKDRQDFAKTLEQSEYILKRQADDLRIQVAGLQQRFKMQQMPGSY